MVLSVFILTLNASCGPFRAKPNAPDISATLPQVMRFSFNVGGGAGVWLGGLCKGCFGPLSIWLCIKKMACKPNWSASAGESPETTR